MTDTSPAPAAPEFHGDRELFPGCLDFAVNVRAARPPSLMREALLGAIEDIAAYPSADEAERVRAQIARRHGVTDEEVLLLAGGAEGFALLPALGMASLTCVMPSFTEPLHQGRKAGLSVRTITLDSPFDLPPAAAPERRRHQVVAPTHTEAPTTVPAALRQTGEPRPAPAGPRRTGESYEPPGSRAQRGSQNGGRGHRQPPAGQGDCV